MVENSKEGTAWSSTTYTGHAAGERGYYYNWTQANLSNNACPTGWHLPYNNEFNTVITAVGSTKTGIGQWWNTPSSFAGSQTTIWGGWNTSGSWWCSTTNQVYLGSGTLGGPITAGMGVLSPVRCVQD